MLRYILLNVWKAKKLYIPLVIILAIVIYILMSSFALRENAIIANRQYVGDHPVVVIFEGNSSPANERKIINEEFSEAFNNADYVTDYYSFCQWPAGSNSLKSIIPSIPFAEFWVYEEDDPSPFNLMIYSDIEKSMHFKNGDRKITEGRFAINVNECNISTAFAELNGLAVGETIEIYLRPINPQNYNFTIVGIYEDATEEISNELPSISPLKYNVYGAPRSGSATIASQNNNSRNQILTTAKSSKDITALSVWGIDVGYDVVVYYTDGMESTMALTEEFKNSLPAQFITMDSMDVTRSTIMSFEKAEQGFTQFLVIMILISVIFCGLIIFFILKNRVYDIGVFRARGMSRIKVTILISSEVFIASIFAFIFAFVLYLKSFIPFMGTIYYLQSNSIWNAFYFTGSFKGHEYIDYNSFDIARNHELLLSLNPIIFIFGFLAIVVFTLMVGLVSVSFISRHEPMKTMTEL